MEVITPEEEELIKILKERDIDKDSGIGVSILTRKFKKVQEMIKWLKENPKAKQQEICEYLDELCNFYEE